MIDKADTSAKKSLGQHFLKDTKAIRRIVQAVPADASVLEIGPGLGALTEALVERASHLILVEKDVRFAQAWLERAEGEPTLEVLHADVLDVLEKVVRETKPQWIVGNLPYNISGTLTARLTAIELSGGMVLMYQREVAERIAADPGNRIYGTLSVLARHFYDVKRLLTLPPGAFSPPPKVHSAVLLFTRHGRKPPCSFEALQAAVRQGFATRRKTIANNFREQLCGADWVELVIDPVRRPETLDYTEWSRIASRLALNDYAG